MSLLISVFVLFFSLSQADAKPFANSFIEFNAPDSWACAESGAYWTCQPMDPKKIKDAVVVMASGPQGPGDSMQEYYDYLKTSLDVYDPASGKKAKSSPAYTQYKDIFGQKWVDSQHLSTAVPGYFTRYLATVKDGRAVLFTVTVDKTKYNIYMSELYKLIESMRVRMSLPAEPVDTGLKGLLFGQKQAVNTALGKKEKKGITIGGQEGSSWGLVVAIITAVLVFVVAYIYIKRRRNRDKNKDKKGFFKK